MRLLRDLIAAVRAVRAARESAPTPTVSIETLVPPENYEPFELAECVFFVSCIGHAMGAPAGRFVLCSPPARSGS